MSLSAAESSELALHPRALVTGAGAKAEPVAFSAARLLLVTALVGAPLASGAEVTWAWVALGLVASLGLLLWAVGSVQQGAVKLIWSPLYLPLGMFFLLGVVQYTARLTLDTSETRQALVLLAADLVFFFLAVQLFAEIGSETWRTFGLTVLLLAGSLGLFTVLQSASGESRAYGGFGAFGNLFGPYDNPDHYAGLMEMLIPVAVLYIAERQRRLSAATLALLLLPAGVAVASLLLSGSRGGLIALLVEIAIAAVVGWWGGRMTGKRGLTAAVTILAALLVFSWVDSGWASKRLAALVHVESSAWADGSRKSWTLDSLRVWRDHPVVGVGLGNLATVFPGYQSLPNELWVEHAHDDYVEALAETGVVGAILIIAALALFFRLAFGELGQQLRSEGGWIRLGAALGCCGLLVHSLFDYNLRIPANAAWFAVLAGMATSDRGPAARTTS